MLKRIENQIRIWATKMNLAEEMGDLPTYNKCCKKIQELEAQYEALLG